MFNIINSPFDSFPKYTMRSRKSFIKKEREACGLARLFLCLPFSLWIILLPPERECNVEAIVWYTGHQNSCCHLCLFTSSIMDWMKWTSKNDFKKFHCVLKDLMICIFMIFLLSPVRNHAFRASEKTTKWSFVCRVPSDLLYFNWVSLNKKKEEKDK